MRKATFSIKDSEFRGSFGSLSKIGVEQMADFDSISADKILTRYDIVVESSEKPEDIAEQYMPENPLLRQIAEDVMNLKFKVIEQHVQEALKTLTPEEIIENGLLAGMDIVAELYGRGIYYLPHVMVASDAMTRGTKVAEAALGGERKYKGVVMMHAAEGDPHDIGKNIAAVLLKSNGFGIIDLGKDVLVDTVVDEVVKQKPNVLTGTALMTTTMSAFPRIANRLKEHGVEVPFICAGGAVNREYVESYDMGIYSAKAAEGPGLVNGKA
ncbi:methanol--corrinoid methyltransferase [Candidatus Methanomassiliicoccus intestinalis]|uniref:Methanol--corrinoid methyltransferase n=1 Tax=Candidatus Methanomassiliicoccus intestinalis TaxID=1406512 RepID=A0A8J8TEI2_9ARCH|nr:MAG: methanol--corrinoid methyltransferase [Candidatus Methanomassiliicoccus intestinalis]